MSEDDRVEAAGILRGGPGLGSGVGDFREAADNAARLTAKVDQIIDELRSGATGVEILVGPLEIFGLTIPEIPLRFKLTK